MARESTDPPSPTRRRALALLVLAPPLMMGLPSSDVAPAYSNQAGRLRIAMLSFWHVHALDYAHQALSNAAVTLVGVWDEELERGQAQARTFGVPFYQHLADLLAHPDIDGVIVDAPTTMHRDVIAAAAQAGKHIFTEKVLAPTLRECNEIVAAVNKANVALMVSLPRLYAGSTLAIQQILKQKLLGEVSQVRTRLFHDGALRTLLHPQGWLPPAFFNPQQTAGGAMIDLGAHPMYLARVLLGLPESVSATYGYMTGRAVEDNAVAMLRYPQGAVGIVEAGFVNPLAPFTIEAHGTEGSLLYGTPDDKIQIRSAHISKPAGVWSVWTVVPPDQPTAFQQWVEHIQQGTRPQENTQIAVDLSMLMEAANLSARRSQPVRLDSLSR